MSDARKAIFQYGGGVGEDFWGNIRIWEKYIFLFGGRQSGIFYPGDAHIKREPFTGSRLDAPGGWRWIWGLREGMGWRHMGGIAGFSEAKIGRREGEISVWRGCWGRIFVCLANVTGVRNMKEKDVLGCFGILPDKKGSFNCDLNEFNLVCLKRLIGDYFAQGQTARDVQFVLISMAKPAGASRSDSKEVVGWVCQLIGRRFLCAYLGKTGSETFFTFVPLVVKILV